MWMILLDCLVTGQDALRDLLDLVVKQSAIVFLRWWRYAFFVFLGFVQIWWLQFWLSFSPFSQIFVTFSSSSNIYIQSGFSLLLFTTTDHRTQMFWASLKQSVFGDTVTQGGQVEGNTQPFHCYNRAMIETLVQLQFRNINLLLSHELVWALTACMSGTSNRCSVHEWIFKTPYSNWTDYTDSSLSLTESVAVKFHFHYYYYIPNKPHSLTKLHKTFLFNYERFKTGNVCV